MEFHLSGFDSAAFLRDYWQKRPLLIRNPWRRWANPLEPEELAGLACEAEVESRLVMQAQDAPTLEHGPFPESRFGRLGKPPWTLLVQAVDHHVPAVAALLEPFRFIPNWRIDDVMVSYATEGGGVGPHYDQYDVFLVQGLGHRRWRIGGLCDEASELLPHEGLRLLARFEPVQEWVLGPGDILYLPPRVAHDGVAEGDACMTYSIGFRAPSRLELIEAWSESALLELDDDDRYADPDLAAQDNPGEILPMAIERARQMIAGTLDDHAAFARWVAAYATTPGNPDLEWQPETPLHAQDVRRLARKGTPLLRNPASRFAFIREAQGLMLFVDGQAYPCSGPAVELAEQLCARPRIVLGPDAALPEAAVGLLTQLLNRGNIAFDEEGDEEE